MSDAPQTPDTLEQRLLADRGKRPSILSACERMIEDEVAGKGGLSGLAIKGGYKVVQAVKPGIIRESLDHLLDDFVRRLEPFFATHRQSGGEPRAFGDALRSQSGAVADALLAITDEKAKRAKNATLKGAYDKLRPQAKKHVEEAVPRVGRTLSSLL
jgi:hypothetical protein